MSSVASRSKRRKTRRRSFEVGVKSGLCWAVLFLSSCTPSTPQEFWSYEIDFGAGQSQGTMKIEKNNGQPELVLISVEDGTFTLDNLILNDETLSGDFMMFGKEANLLGTFKGDSFSGNVRIAADAFTIAATKQTSEPVVIDRSQIAYTLSKHDLSELESDIDHAGIISAGDREGYKRGERIYSSNCINCHGNEEVEGSIPLSTKFWAQDLKAGSDAYSMYQTISRGYGSMPPQPVLTPQEKYDVILFVRQKYLKKNPKEQFVVNSPGYLAGLPKGTSQGPETKPYQPWVDMDYGDFFINTYELVDEKTGIERYHSPRPVPYPDEDYLENNFAYKGIAVRLDKGDGGISKGKAWMIFDHDLMRIAGGWTGNGFIDWNGILLNDKHETYPRTIGKLHFETPVGPGWANPKTGSFDDPRWKAKDGRSFGPLPKSWANYKGLYHYNDAIVVSYSVGDADVLEKFGLQNEGTDTIFTRTLTISASKAELKMRVAPETTVVELAGEGASLSKEDGYVLLKVKKAQEVKVKLFITTSKPSGPLRKAIAEVLPEDLKKYTKGGGAPHYPEVVKSTITKGPDQDTFAIDLLTPPFDNPWSARMKMSGIDFMSDSNIAVICTTDGDVWRISGLTDNSSELQWQRIGAGLFQPLGIKVVNDEIYVICRDQLVVLRDFNGDNETDFYESFNHDHQVTDHFHEFAMGLQADKEGSFYYAKSGRHAREALVPQHGTLLKVSPDGAKTDIIATGFRAANGVCMNPDGSFLVTDQQGFWNPMNRINWVDGKGKFYGNMWGYNPPKDSTRVAMEAPMVWVDMEFDRSPSELLWVTSEKWGALNGSLLSFSYGFGKIQLVLNEKVNGQMQGGVIDLPGIKFLTGVMRGRFNPGDGQLYACGMSAWGTNQMLRGGGLYRIRYTGKPLTTPLALHATTSGVTLKFDAKLDVQKASNISNYTVKTWRLKRSSNYGSDRYEERVLPISRVAVVDGGAAVRLFLETIEPVDVMTISYDISTENQIPYKGTVQNTIHNLRVDSAL